MSEQIGELAAALSKAQGQFKPLLKTAENPFYKSNYATLADQWDSVRQALTENGLALPQTTEILNEDLVLRTTLIHTSGQWLSFLYPVTAKGRTLKDKANNPVGEEKPDAQAIGSAISYARRYSMAAVLGLAAEEEDDGEAASGRGKQKPQKEQAKESPQADNLQDNEMKKLMKQIHAIGAQKGRTHDQLSETLTKFFKVESMKDLTVAQLKASITKLNTLPDKPNDITAAHQELVKSLAQVIGYKYEDVLEYIQITMKQNNWDWKYIQVQSAKWVSDDKEKFVNNIVDYFASKKQPGL